MRRTTGTVSGKDGQEDRSMQGRLKQSQARDGGHESKIAVDLDGFGICTIACT